MSIFEGLNGKKVSETKSIFEGLNGQSINQLEVNTNPIESAPLQNPSQNQIQAPEPQNDYGEDFGEKSLSSSLRPFTNEAVAGAVGSLPDLAGLAVNAEEFGRSALTGSTPHYVPSITDKIADFLNKGLSEQEKLRNVAKYSTRFLSSLFGLGYVGKGIESVGKAVEGTKGLASTGKALEKTGSFISKNLGMTDPSLRNIGAATAAGATAGFSKDARLPWQAEIPAVLFAFMFGGGAGAKFDKLLKPIFDKVPGLKKVVEKQNFKEMAQYINPESLEDLVKNSILEGETQFLAEKTLSEFPAELQNKIKSSPELLNESEINSILEKGNSDYQNYIRGLEKEYGINLTAGEFTTSPKVIAKEDVLANKPDIETFDSFTKNRRAKIVRKLHEIKHKISSESTDKAELGNVISKEVEGVYDQAYKLRTTNWNKRFGDIIDDPIIPVQNYIGKLKEFSQLRADNEGAQVAIKLATKKLKDGIAYENGGKISPKRINDILVGLNEDLMRFADRTFSKKQVGELKNSLESDLDSAINSENILSADQAQIVRSARNGYKEDSKIIDDIDKSILFSKIDKGTLSVPEKVTKALENMEPTEIKVTLNALKRSENYSDVIPKIQRYIVEDALKTAIKSGVEFFNPRLFLNKLPEKEIFNLIFEGTNALKEIKDISLLLKRIWKYEPQRKGSPTFQRFRADSGDIEESVFSAGVDLAKGKVPTALTTLGNAVSHKNSSQIEKAIADILISPEKRTEILKYIGEPKQGFNFKAPAVQEGINIKERKGSVKFDSIPKIGVGRMISKFGQMSQSDVKN